MGRAPLNPLGMPTGRLRVPGHKKVHPRILQKFPSLLLFAGLPTPNTAHVAGKRYEEDARPSGGILSKNGNLPARHLVSEKSGEKDGS
jgi:hypothetical protein